MVEGERRSHARLFPRGEYARPAILALSRRALCKGNFGATLVHAWTFCMNKFKILRPKNTPFAEFAVTTNFSFLRGASHPEEYVARAIELGLSGIGIADRNSLAGI